MSIPFAVDKAMTPDLSLCSSAERKIVVERASVNADIPKVISVNDDAGTQSITTESLTNELGETDIERHRPRTCSLSGLSLDGNVNLVEPDFDFENRKGNNIPWRFLSTVMRTQSCDLSIYSWNSMTKDDESELDMDLDSENLEEVMSPSTQNSVSSAREWGWFDDLHISLRSGHKSGGCLVEQTYGGMCIEKCSNLQVNYDSSKEAEAAVAFPDNGFKKGRSQAAVNQSESLREDAETFERLIVLDRGDNEIGTTFSKSFPRRNGGGAVVGVAAFTISIPSYRVVKSTKSGSKFAQFFVTFREGTVCNTFGVWKRYSDFEEIYHKVHEGQGCSDGVLSPVMRGGYEMESLPNANATWNMLKKMKRWYRCLDNRYLSHKCVLLEQFLHDILIESSSPKVLREFVGADCYPTGSFCGREATF